VLRPPTGKVSAGSLADLAGSCAARCPHPGVGSVGQRPLVRGGVRYLRDSGTGVERACEAHSFCAVAGTVGAALCSRR
jgi:hypothetical protein